MKQSLQRTSRSPFSGTCWRRGRRGGTGCAAAHLGSWLRRRREGRAHPARRWLAPAGVEGAGARRLDEAGSGAGSGRMQSRAQRLQQWVDVKRCRRGCHATAHRALQCPAPLAPAHQRRDVGSSKCSSSIQPLPALGSVSPAQCPAALHPPRRSAGGTARPPARRSVDRAMQGSGRTGWDLSIVMRPCSTARQTGRHRGTRAAHVCTRPHLFQADAVAVSIKHGPHLQRTVACRRRLWSGTL